MWRNFAGKPSPRPTRYADTETVKRGIGATRLHKIVVVYKGMEMRICEEVG